LTGDSLIQTIREELSNIDQSVNEALDAYEKLQSTNDRHYLNSVDLNIHSFYLGLERIFRKIAKDIDGEVPEGSSWHKDLLEQMNKEYESIRPAVISDETIGFLDEYSRFYHVIHHIYGIKLEKELLTNLFKSLQGDWANVQSGIKTFIDYRSPR
jgi:hypothetical protein